MNSEVKATGMTVNASADASLVIQGGTDSAFTAVGTNALSQDTLKPVTSWDGVNFGKLSTGVKVLSAHDHSATWLGTEGAFTSSSLTLVTSSDRADYVADTTYLIKNVGANATLYVKSFTTTIVMNY